MGIHYIIIYPNSVQKNVVLLHISFMLDILMYIFIFQILESNVISNIHIKFSFSHFNSIV